MPLLVLITLVMLLMVAAMALMMSVMTASVVASASEVFRKVFWNIHMGFLLSHFEHMVTRESQYLFPPSAT
jgi:hypothetical protein